MHSFKELKRVFGRSLMSCSFHFCIFFTIHITRQKGSRARFKREGTGALASYSPVIILTLAISKLVISRFNCIIIKVPMTYLTSIDCKGLMVKRENKHLKKSKIHNSNLIQLIPRGRTISVIVTKALSELH